MTADYFPFPHEFLGRAATRIINEVRCINASSATLRASRRGRSSGGEGIRRSFKQKRN
jgi:GMP synthase (glutamine-hydrolysing)